MAESETHSASGSAAEELVPKRGATPVVWKRFDHQIKSLTYNKPQQHLRSERRQKQQQKGAVQKLISPPQAEAPG